MGEKYKGGFYKLIRFFRNSDLVLHPKKRGTVIEFPCYPIRTQTCPLCP